MDENEAWEKYQGELSPLARAGASVAGKLDTLGQLLNNISTDTSRTAETVIPQLEGDQNAIDVANDQAAGMSGMGGDTGGMLPMPDAGGMDGASGGAPMPDVMPDMPSEGADMGMGGAPAPAPTGGPAAGGLPPVGQPPMDAPGGDMSSLFGELGAPGRGPQDDMGADMPEEGTPGPDIAQDTPMGSVTETDPSQLDYSMFAYSPEEALNDFISTITETAHSALDQGDTQTVANITGFIDGVKQLWEQYMGGTAMPGGLDPAQSMDVPPTIESEGPAEDVGGEAIGPDVGPESAGEPPMPESRADEGPGEDKPEGKPEGGSEEKKDDDKKDKDVKKSESCDDAEKSEDGEAVEGGEGEAVEGGEAEKATGKTDIGPTEGVKKSFMESRMEEMEAVMNDPANYLDAPTKEIRPQLFTYEKTADIDMNAILEEFKSGTFKSSRPAPQSVMGGVHGVEENAVKKSVSGMFSDVFHDGEPAVEEKSEFEMQLESFTNGLRAR